jgi:D-alanine-D-alanine ligase
MKRHAGFGRIGVLSGGPSSEREISLRSGRAVHKALTESGLDAVFIDVKDDIHDIIGKAGIDVAFIALHGAFGEDGTVQRILAEAGIPYTGSGPEASRAALDKIASKEIFAKRGIPTPRYAVFEKEARMPGDTARVKLPAVVKPQFEGSSIGLSIVKDMKHLEDALQEAFRYGEKALAEEYIVGRELTVGILNDEPLPVIEIVAKNRVYDYEAKYTDPETKYLVPAPVEKGTYILAQRLGKLSHTALGCESFSRVDMMADKDGKVFVLEVNTIPGMTERSLLPKAAHASGINFAKLCIMLLENAVKAVRDEKAKTS